VDAEPPPLPDAGSKRQRLQPAGNYSILIRDLGADDLGADDVKSWVICTGLALPNQQEGTPALAPPPRVFKIW